MLKCPAKKAEVNVMPPNPFASGNKFAPLETLTKCDEQQPARFDWLELLSYDNLPDLCSLKWNSLENIQIPRVSPVRSLEHELSELIGAPLANNIPNNRIMHVTRIELNDTSSDLCMSDNSGKKQKTH